MTRLITHPALWFGLLLVVLIGGMLKALVG